MEKVVNIGKAPDVFCKIKFTDDRLSITGVIGPKKNGDCISCGQVLDSVGAIEEFAAGWNADLLKRFLEVWERWHLNDMRTGTIAQEEAIRAMPKSGAYNYSDACAFLKDRGLLEDNGYVYGTAWLKEKVPGDVMEFLAALPDTKITPDWI
jgi:hypothetical protein